MPMLGQKNVKSDKNTQYYGPKKSIGCPIFFKNVHSLKKQCFHAHIFKKMSILSKTRCSHVICFNFFMKNPLLSCPNLVKKTSNLSKLQCLWANKVNSMPFFPIFYEKTLLSCPYFLKKTSILQKTHCSHAHILSNNVYSLITSMLSCHFFHFFLKPIAVMPIFGKKT